MKAIAFLLGLCSVALGLDGTVQNQIPISAEMKYAGELRVRLECDKANALGHLTLFKGGLAITVPKDELKDIFNVELGDIYFEVTSEDEDKLYMVTVKFDRRPYPWGDGFSEVRFRFKGERYVSRVITVPIAADRRIIKMKNVGAAEE